MQIPDIHIVLLSYVQDLRLVVPCFPSFFDLRISLGQQGLIILLLKSVSTFSKWPKQAEIIVYLTKLL